MTSLVTIHAVADLLIALSYFIIPGEIAYFVARGALNGVNVPVRASLVSLLFGLFILLCGTTHLLNAADDESAGMEVAIIVVQISTALVSMLTACVMYFVLPEVLAVPAKTIEAQEDIQARDHFLSFLSHEIRNPLQSIVGMTELLLLNNEGDPAYRKTVDSIHTSSAMIISLLNSTLDYRKLAEGKLQLEQLELSPSDLVRRILDANEGRASVKAISLVQEDEPGCASVVCVGDPLRICQVLNNLVSNAIKYTPQRGCITVSVSVRDKDDHGECVIFSVQDNGIGIPEDRLETLFTPYEQVRSSDARTNGGTGLGLAIAKQLAELMGGDIEVSSEVGVGSVFALWFPRRVQIFRTEPATTRDISDASSTDVGGTLRRPPLPGQQSLSSLITAQQTSEQAPPHRPYHLADMDLPGFALSDLSDQASSLHDNANRSMGDELRILLVEDNSINRRLLAHVLSNSHYCVCACETAEEALTVVDTYGISAFGLIITDVDLPGMSGPDMVAELRQRGYMGATCAATGTAIERVPKESDLFDRVMIKPIMARKLLELCNTVLREGSDDAGMPTVAE